MQKAYVQHVCLITHHSIWVQATTVVCVWETAIQGHCVCLCIHQRVLYRRLSESVMWIRGVIGRVYVLSCPGRLFSIVACLPWYESLSSGLILFHPLWLYEHQLILSASAIRSLINLLLTWLILNYFFLLLLCFLWGCWRVSQMKSKTGISKCKSGFKRSVFNAFAGVYMTRYYGTSRPYVGPWRCRSRAPPFGRYCNCGLS